MHDPIHIGVTGASRCIRYTSTIDDVREQDAAMSAAILTMEYELGEAQQTLPPESWQVRARQIASMPGLKWKYWLRKPEGNERGGVYLFDGTGDADRAAKILVGSLEEAGARNVRHRIFEVDSELSAITRGRA